MKSATFVAALLGLVSVALGHTTADPGPSPTESYGCVPHNDHWDCEGPRETGAPGAATTTPAHPHDDEDDHDHDSADPGPSPTESYGCVPHNDHWDCEGPRETGAPGAATTTPAHSHDDDDDHSSSTLATVTTTPAAEVASTSSTQAPESTAGAAAVAANLGVALLGFAVVLAN
ncbi:hypothetical protein VTJ49DRAFT_1719 [Mycothermus thermophilus]|uniref:Uncharacterized protein n=1 Tax=Humicola insolens TaxID=85995 RepID=A0ABR3VBY7_HUMIN